MRAGIEKVVLLSLALREHLIDTPGVPTQTGRRFSFGTPRRRGSGRWRLIQRALLPLILFLSAPPFLPNVSAQTPTIRRVTLEGNTTLSSRELTGIMGLGPANPYAPETVDKSMRAALEAYRQVGRLWAEISIVTKPVHLDTSICDIHLTIREGPLAKIAALVLIGNTVWPPGELLATFDSQTGSPFNGGILERDIDRLLTRYEQNGYPYCQVTVTRLDPSDGTVSIEMTVSPGPFIRVGNFQISGNRSTRDRVIFREFRLRRGSPFDQRYLDRGYDRLKRLRLFSNVEQPIVTLNSTGDSVMIGVAVTEAKANFFDGAVGYVPGRAGQTGFLTGSFTLSMHNISGTGRRMAVAWNRSSVFSSDLTMGYEEPWLLGTPLTIGIDFAQLNQDTLYTATQFGLSAKLPLSHAIDGQVHLGWRRVIPDTLSRRALGLSREFSARIGADLDTRDSPINPRNGKRVSLAVEYALRVTAASIVFQPERKSVRTTSARIDIELYQPLWRRQVLAFAIHGVERQSPESVLPVSQQYFLGGARSLRGYRENEFHGSRLAWVNLEYRLLLSSLSRFFVFVDNGYIDYPQRTGNTVQRVRRVKTGYGLGLRVESAIGVLGIDYGVGDADSPFNGKVHFAFQNVF